MFSFLKSLFTKRESRKRFKFLICDDKSEVPLDTWYRLRRWESPHFLRMETEWTRDWKLFSQEETVVGVTYENREVHFLMMGDQPDFKIFLERESENPVDPNAIMVMASATVNMELIMRQLGYLSRETAKMLENEQEIDARAYSVYLPYEDRPYGLRVSVLVRSQAYKRKMEKSK